MTRVIPVQCGCGKVTGVIRNLSSGSSNHVQCPCSGCQAYAHYLGRTDDMLDGEGYSNIFQINPKNFEIHRGMEHIACMKVTPGGPLRWHTDCCKTPLGNSFPKGGIPFLGVLPICTGHKGTSAEVVDMVGPSRARVNERERVPLGRKLQTWAMLVRFLAMLVFWRVTGGKSWRPFFDRDTLKPIKKPIVLTAEERKALYEKVI